MWNKSRLKEGYYEWIIIIKVYALNSHYLQIMQIYFPLSAGSIQDQGIGNLPRKLHKLEYKNVQGLTDCYIGSIYTLVENFASS